MPIFQYEALDPQGAAIKDEIEALSEKEAISKIRNMGYFPTKVRATGAARRAAAKDTAKPKPKRGPDLSSERTFTDLYMQQECESTNHKLSKWITRVSIVPAIVVILVAIYILGVCIVYMSYALANIVSPLLLISIAVAGLMLIFGFVHKRRRPTYWRLSALCLFIPAVCWMCIFFRFGFRMWKLLGTFPAELRFPLGEPRGIAIDSEGRIYCISEFYSRLQVYAGDGRFLRGWFVPSYISGSQLEISNDGTVCISAGGTTYIYSITGAWLGKKKYLEPLEPENYDYEAYDKSGVLYRLERILLLPRIVKYTPNGSKAVVVSDPWHLALLRGAIPAFPFGAACAAAAIAVWHNRRICNSLPKSNCHNIKNSSKH